MSWLLIASCRSIPTLRSIGFKMTIAQGPYNFLLKHDFHFTDMHKGKKTCSAEHVQQPFIYFS
jgi:hypothetical protein